MSEQDAEQNPGEEPTSADSGDDGLDGLQEQHLDSVTGGGDIPKPTMDVQAQDFDTIKKSDDQDRLETKERSRPNSGDGD